MHPRGRSECVLESVFVCFEIPPVAVSWIYIMVLPVLSMYEKHLAVTLISREKYLIQYTVVNAIDTLRYVIYTKDDGHRRVQVELHYPEAFSRQR